MSRCFCRNCGKETEYYNMQEIQEVRSNGKTFPASITVAICMECNNFVSPPGLLEQNSREVIEQYDLESLEI